MVAIAGVVEITWDGGLKPGMTSCQELTKAQDAYVGAQQKRAEAHGWAAHVVACHVAWSSWGRLGPRVGGHMDKQFSGKPSIRIPNSSSV